MNIFSKPGQRAISNIFKNALLLLFVMTLTSDNSLVNHEILSINVESKVSQNLISEKFAHVLREFLLRFFEGLSQRRIFWLSIGGISDVKLKTDKKRIKNNSLQWMAPYVQEQFHCTVTTGNASKVVFIYETLIQSLEAFLVLLRLQLAVIHVTHSASFWGFNNELEIRGVIGNIFNIHDKLVRSWWKTSVVMKWSFFTIQIDGSWKIQKFICKHLWKMFETHMMMPLSSCNLSL